MRYQHFLLNALHPSKYVRLIVDAMQASSSVAFPLPRANHERCSTEDKYDERYPSNDEREAVRPNSTFWMSIGEKLFLILDRIHDNFNHDQNCCSCKKKMQEILMLYPKLCFILRYEDFVRICLNLCLFLCQYYGILGYVN